MIQAKHNLIFRFSQVTVFGESAGAISIANLYLNSGLERLARATVCIPTTSLRRDAEILCLLQIMESGMSGTLPVFNASQNQAVWDSFISNIPECVNTSAAGISIPCAQNVSTETLLDALNQTNTTFGGLFVFVPVIDGTDGIIPALPALMIAEGNYSRIPYIAGQNLDEGVYSFVARSLPCSLTRSRHLLRHIVYPQVSQHDRTTRGTLHRRRSPYHWRTSTSGFRSCYSAHARTIPR